MLGVWAGGERWAAGAYARAARPPPPRVLPPPVTARTPRHLVPHTRHHPPPLQLFTLQMGPTVARLRDWAASPVAGASRCARCAAPSWLVHAFSSAAADTLCLRCAAEGSREEVGEVDIYPRPEVRERSRGLWVL